MLSARGNSNRKKEQCMRAGDSEWLGRKTVTSQLCCASFGPKFFLEGRAQ